MDEEHPYSPLQPPRGYGGVAIVWKHTLTRVSKMVLKTPDIVATELTIEGAALLVISVYMPCRGLQGSDIKFSRVLDRLNQLLQEYITHPILLAGDWNASMSRTPPEVRDSRFASFIQENHLTLLPLPPDTPTFMHHNKKDNSQIDYILTRSLPKVKPPRVHEPPMGTSDHHAVLAEIVLPVGRDCPGSNVTELTKPKQSSLQPYPKINWRKVDLTMYKTSITVPPLESTFTETMLALAGLAKSLRELELASELASPPIAPRRSKFKVSSPEIREAAREKSVQYALWKQAG